MKIGLIVVFSIFVCGSLSHADDPLVIPFGHNVSATSYTLRAKECSIGLQTVACGLSDYLSFGVSPWLLEDYNMIALLARLRLGTNEDTQNTLQLGYFKTYSEADPYAYDMEMTWFYYIHSVFLSPMATVHFNAQAMYFRDDRAPFSLRRPWFDRKPIQLNATALTEIHVIGGWYINAELGVLGLAQQDPEYLFAVTFEYRLKRWLFHGGFSQLGTYAAYWNPIFRGDYQQALRGTSDGFDGTLYRGEAHYDYSIHPEFALQFYF